MQISFNPKEIDIAEASFILAFALAALVKGCKAQGDTKAEFMASMAELTEANWDGLAQAGEEG